MWKEIPNTENPPRWSFLKRNYKILGISCCAVILTCLVIFVTLWATKEIISSPNRKPGRHGYPTDTSEQDKIEPIDLPEDPEANLTLSGKLRIISRREWVAQPPSQPAEKLNTPVPFVIILHTATENCTDQAACVFHVRYIQTYHIDSYGWWDIGYSFLVGGDGFAYEGRGWTSEGAFTYGYNSRAIGIAFIGTFNTMLPPDRQILAAKQLIEQGVQKGYIHKNYKLFAHRQLSRTQSPGEALYNNIKTWPHWSGTPNDPASNSSATNETMTGDVSSKNITIID